MAEIWKEALEEIRDASFSEIDGCVLRDGAWDEETLRSWKEHYQSNLSGIEAMINHFHVYRLFWEGGEELRLSEVVDVGRTVVRAWNMTLSSQFPKLDLVVEFNESLPPDGTLVDLQVTAYVQRRA